MSGLLPFFGGIKASLRLLRFGFDEGIVGKLAVVVGGQQSGKRVGEGGSSRRGRAGERKVASEVKAGTQAWRTRLVQEVQLAGKRSQT